MANIPASVLKPDIKSRLEWRAEQVAWDYKRAFFKTIACNKVSSPIEQMFLLEWQYARVEERCNVHLHPQAPISTKLGVVHVDFRVVRLDSSGNDNLRLVIELDGHEFHEKTKQQVAEDNRRERAIKCAGFRVFRFSGSEIMNKPADRVQEVVEFIESRS